MAFMTWNDTLSVGVEEIDKQHQQLLKLINELYDAMQIGKGNDAVGKIIKGLIDYTGFHFRTEEDYFRKLNYPDADEHIQEHTNFVKKAADFKNDFDQKKVGLSIGLMKFLSDWLRNHIGSSDKKYTIFFNQNGII